MGKQQERLRKLKQERNSLKVREALRELRRAADNQENLVPSLIRSVTVYTTVGEMCDVLREVYGEYTAQGYF